MTAQERILIAEFVEEFGRIRAAIDSVLPTINARVSKHIGEVTFDNFYELLSPIIATFVDTVIDDAAKAVIEFSNSEPLLLDTLAKNAELEAKLAKAKEEASPLINQMSSEVTMLRKKLKIAEQKIVEYEKDIATKVKEHYNVVSDVLHYHGKDVKRTEILPYVGGNSIHDHFHLSVQQHGVHISPNGTSLEREAARRTNEALHVENARLGTVNSLLIQSICEIFTSIDPNWKRCMHIFHKCLINGQVQCLDVVSAYKELKRISESENDRQAFADHASRVEEVNFLNKPVKCDVYTSHAKRDGDGKGGDDYARNDIVDTDTLDFCEQVPGEELALPSTAEDADTYAAKASSVVKKTEAPQQESNNGASNGSEVFDVLGNKVKPERIPNFAAVGSLPGCCGMSCYRLDAISNVHKQTLIQAMQLTNCANANSNMSRQYGRHIFSSSGDGMSYDIVVRKLSVFKMSPDVDAFLAALGVEVCVHSTSLLVKNGKSVHSRKWGKGHNKFHVGASSTGFFPLHVPPMGVATMPNTIDVTPAFITPPNMDVVFKRRYVGFNGVCSASYLGKYAPLMTGGKTIRESEFKARFPKGVFFVPGINKDEICFGLVKHVQGVPVIAHYPSYCATKHLTGPVTSPSQFAMPKYYSAYWVVNSTVDIHTSTGGGAASMYTSSLYGPRGFNVKSEPLFGMIPNAHSIPCFYDAISLYVSGSGYYVEQVFRIPPPDPDFAVRLSNTEILSTSHRKEEYYHYLNMFVGDSPPHSMKDYHVTIRKRDQVVTTFISRNFESPLIESNGTHILSLGAIFATRRVYLGKLMTVRTLKGDICHYYSGPNASSIKDKLSLEAEGCSDVDALSDILLSYDHSSFLGFTATMKWVNVDVLQELAVVDHGYSIPALDYFPSRVLYLVDKHGDRIRFFGSTE